MKTAVITGAAQGVGRAAAERFAAAGYRLVLTDLQPLDVVAAGIGTAAVSTLCGDLASEAFVTRVAAHTAALGGADVLVNNAGISLILPAEATTLEDWNRVMAVNLAAPFLLCRDLGAQMLAKGAGAIVNVASIAGLGGVIHRSAYNAAKHGLVGLTRTLAAEWGGRGVRVNAVCPGWIKTEMDEKDRGSGAYGDADIVDRVPQARFAQPGDVADAILFLASDAAGFINGASLPVDGGWSNDLSWDNLRRASRAAH